jgi:hypothetical protein
MMRGILFLTLCAAALFLTTCDGSSSSKKTMSVDTFFETYRETLCDSSSKYSDGIINASNKSSCSAAIMESLFAWDFFHAGRLTVFKQKVYLLRKAETKGWLKIEADQAQKCFSTVSQMQPYNPLDLKLFDIADCALAFKGEKIINDQCYQDEECDSGWCNLAGGACPGRCVLYRKQGEPCNENLDRCEPGYTCLTSGCSRLSSGAKGEPCMADEHCASYLYCKKGEGDATGICFEKKGIGKSCEETRECLTGLTCTDTTCQGAELPDTAGADCSATKLCNYFSRLECGRDGESYTCRTFPSGESDQCTFQCGSQLYCSPNTYTCTYFSKLEEPCGKYYECSSLYCNDAGFCDMPECEQTIEF